MNAEWNKNAAKIIQTPWKRGEKREKSWQHEKAHKHTHVDSERD